MKLKQHFIKGSIIFSMVASTALYATNGDTLVGVGAKTRSMGGAGIAFSHGAESTLVNPALITYVPNTEISFGGTIFMPDIHTSLTANTQQGAITDTADSDADISMIPAVAIVSHLNNDVYIGAGMYGTAGMGTDFRGLGASNWMQGNSKLFDMETTLQLMQFVVPVAYKNGGLSIGIAPIIQYGSLDIHYAMYDQNGQPGIVSPGQKQDFGFGANIGMTYDFGNGITLGAMYKSKVKMDYGNTLSAAAAPFGITLDGHLDQPAEYGIGLGWRSGPHGIAIDWKRILWGHAAGYKDFGWDDQDVFAVGYQYDAGTWALRIGYNHGKMPITINNSNNQVAAAKDMFNLLGFPATAEDHITAGGSYQFSKNFSADFTVVYALNKKNSANVGAAFGYPAQAVTIKNEHKELGLTVQLNYKF
jgi:long-chain fatty acid transport protein